MTDWVKDKVVMMTGGMLSRTQASFFKEGM